jgi:hypothetical protein
MHPEEPTCPCCLPALGEFSEIPPHGGLSGSVGNESGTVETGGDQSRIREAMEIPVATAQRSDFTARRADR